MRKQEIKLIMILISAVSMAIILSNCSLKSSPQKVVEDYVSSYNSHQVDKIIALYADSVTFEVIGFNINIRGREAVRSIVEYDSALVVKYQGQRRYGFLFSFRTERLGRRRGDSGGFLSANDVYCRR